MGSFRAERREPSPCCCGRSTSNLSTSRHTHQGRHCWSRKLRCCKHPLLAFLACRLMFNGPTQLRTRTGPNVNAPCTRRLMFAWQNMVEKRAWPRGPSEVDHCRVFHHFSLAPVPFRFCTLHHNFTPRKITSATRAAIPTPSTTTTRETATAESQNHLNIVLLILRYVYAVGARYNSVG